MYNALVPYVLHTAGIYRDEIAKIIESDTFRGSTSSRKLLEYLGERTLSGDSDELKEYTIGVEAFGRASDYDPQVDPSVRVQVSRLRKRLATYFETEGADDGILIELPKRQFALRFVDREEQAAENSPGASPEPEPASLLSAPSNPWRIAALVLAVLLALVVFYPWAVGPARVADQKPAFTPAMQEFWAPYLNSALPTTLSLGVAMFIRVPSDDRLSTTYLRQATVNEWPPTEDVPGLEVLREAIGGNSQPHAVYNYAGVGEAIGAFLVGRSLGAAGQEVSIVRSPFLSWDEAKRSNVVYVGAPKFNRHIEAGAFERNFRVVPEGIENLGPKDGEPAFFEKVVIDGATELVHAVVARYPNASGPGWVTVFASNDGTGTWAATEFVTRPELAQEMVDRIRLPDGSLPLSFEVVLRIRCDQDFPVETTYVTHRAY